MALYGCSSAPAPRATVPGGTPAPRPAPATTQTLSFTFTSDHAAIVHAYYDDQGGRPGNGRGRGGLPPGIEKNLARGKPLPPGIAKQYLPSELLVRLPTVPRGTEYIVVAGKLLLVEIATQMVRDVLIEAVFG
jgi:hypothetical protein